MCSVRILEMSILEMSRSHVKDYVAAKVNQHEGPRRCIMEKWMPPEQSTLKLNSDAGCRRGCGTGLGGVLRDHNDLVAWAFAQSMRESLSVDVAEAQAIRAGVEMTVEKGVRSKDHCED